MSRYVKNAFPSRTGTMTSIKPLNAAGQQRLMDKLRYFRFREFDTVRVFVYSGTQSLRDRMNDLNDHDIDEGFAFTPRFTGLVNTISRQSASGGMPTITANCVGMMRIFMHSVMVFSRAVADVLLKEVHGTMNPKDMNVLQNSFSQASFDEAVKKLVSLYLFPKFTKDGSIGYPDIKQFEYSSTAPYLDLNAAESKIQELIVPFFPTLLIYHYIKMAHKEAIVIFDDKVGLPSSGNSYPQQSGVAQPVGKAGDLSKWLKPYLTMVREGYQLWDSTFMSPADIFSEIRKTTFLEIFEDGAGTFHFRFPRYNKSSAVVIGDEDAISVNHLKDDSSNYNAIVSKLSSAMIGGVSQFPGIASVDQTSVFRYGFRMPQTVSNPNMTSTTFMGIYGDFLRDYSTGSQSRTAHISRVGDCNIDIGETISFSPIIEGRRVGSSGSEWSAVEDHLFGYADRVSEAILVGQSYIQNITANFVRPVSKNNHIPRPPIKGIVYKPMWASLLSLSGPGLNAHKASKDLSYTQGNLLNRSQRETRVKADYSIWVDPVSEGRDPAYRAYSFRSYRDVSELASAAADPKVMDEHEKTIGELVDTKLLTTSDKIRSALDASAASLRKKLVEKAHLERQIDLIKAFVKEVLFLTIENTSWVPFASSESAQKVVPLMKDAYEKLWWGAFGEVKYTTEIVDNGKFGKEAVVTGVTVPGQSVEIVDNGVVKIAPIDDGDIGGMWSYPELLSYMGTAAEDDKFSSEWNSLSSDVGSLDAKGVKFLETLTKRAFTDSNSYIEKLRYDLEGSASLAKLDAESLTARVNTLTSNLKYAQAAETNASLKDKTDGDRTGLASSTEASSSQVTQKSGDESSAGTSSVQPKSIQQQEEEFRDSLRLEKLNSDLVAKRNAAGWIDG
jgi:hypothetical protein